MTRKETLQERMRDSSRALNTALADLQSSQREYDRLLYEYQQAARDWLYCEADTAEHDTICPVCHGTGRELYEPQNPALRPYYRPCHNCDGTGEVK